MMWASVVLPSPGGPNISTWSSASPRRRAASMKMLICSFTGAWPMYSARRLGRTVRSSSSSSRVATAAMTRSCSIIAPPLPCGRLQRAAYQFLGAGAFIVDGLQESRHFARPVTERHQGGIGLGLRPDAIHCPLSSRRQLAERAYAVAHLDQQALSGLAADARNPGEGVDVLCFDAQQEGVDVNSGQQCKADLRADARDTQQVPKQPPLVLGRETVQQVRVLADHEMRVQLDLAAQLGQAVERRHRRLQLVTDAAHVDQERRWLLADQLAAKEADHRAPPR